MIHRGLAAGRWYELTLVEQMANVGAEVGRAIAWRKKADARLAEQAFERALDLLDLTLDDRRRGAPALREVARVREVLCDAFCGFREYRVTLEEMDRYFMEFAMAAALLRERDARH